MTREDAISYFNRHIDLYCVTGICREAEEMAIEALNQPEIIRCKDCDEWLQGRDLSGAHFCSDAGFCCNWRVITGEDFYCGEAQKR